MKRRHFFLGGAALAGAAGALVVGWSVLPPRQRLMPDDPLPTAPGEVALNGWVKISADNRVIIMMSQTEMGQGTHTGLAMLLADELDADWAQVRLEQAPLDRIYNNQTVLRDGLPFLPGDDGAVARATKWMVAKLIREIPGAIGTAGSSSIKDQWLPLREAGAAARAALIEAAALRWKLPAAELRTEAGRVLHPSGRSASFGELAADAAAIKLEAMPALKQPDQFRLIGQPVRRLDAAAKLDGSARYGIDMLPDGLLYASVTLCPTLGGTVASVDDRAARAMPGVRKLVNLPAFPAGLAGAGQCSGGVAIIADSPFQAMRALEKLDIQWNHGPAAGVASADILSGLGALLDSPPTDIHREEGDIDAVMATASRTVTADYRVPYIAHATMEPMNATAQVKNGTATVWGATQAPAVARAGIASALGIDADKVTLHIPLMGGSFGRRSFGDYLGQAALIAAAADGAPVQTFWSREQDMTHDFYRPALAARHRAGIDAQGRLIAWEATSAGTAMGAPSIMARNVTHGLFNNGYSVPHLRIGHTVSEAPIPVGVWRSVSHTYTVFFVESFMDEAAAAAGQDPLAFRAALLADNPRMLRALHRLGDFAAWNTPAPAGTGRGLSIHRCFGSVAAMMAEVTAEAGGGFRVRQVDCVIDCGFPLNPNLIRQQVEGGIIDGLSAAMHGEVTIVNGQVQQSNFHDYPLLRMDEAPAIRVDIIPSTDKPGGIGELATPGIAPAVANALFALDGRRRRSLPLITA